MPNRMNLARASADTSSLSAVLQSSATALEPRVFGSVVATHERCVMNNVLELNN